ncbi:MATE family efflux transporter [Candidatus Cloacimonadota bacterium]
MINKDLTQGKITGSILKLMIPIVATSLIQMAYNLTDLIWIGRKGSDAVASVGTAGFFTWLGFALIIITKIGAQVSVAQAAGRKEWNSVAVFARNALQLNFFLALAYGTFLFIFKEQLIGFFKLENLDVVNGALLYISIISLGIFFLFVNPVFTGIFNGMGDSKTPFLVNTVGLILNIVLDPLLIFGVGPFPEWGVAGAAIATIFSQFVVTMIFLHLIHRKFDFEFSLFKLPVFQYIRSIIKLGIPVGAHSALFTIFAIVLARIIARWGATPIAVQKVGAHVEAISWMTSDGLATAMATFIGQNFGARKWERIWKGFFSGISMAAILGIITTFLLVFFSDSIFKIFIPEEQAISYGTVYLKILGYSQLFMCVEIAVGGAFNGLGRTIPPSVIGILFTGLRIPLALFLAQEHLLGLNGVWWSVSITSIIKGILLFTWFLLLLYKHPEIKPPPLQCMPGFRWTSRYFRDKKCIQEKPI